MAENPVSTLVIDIGGTNVKLWRTGEADKIKIDSGKEMTPQLLIDERTYPWLN